MKSKKNLNILLALYLFFLAGCAEVPLTSTKLDLEAKKFQPISGKSLLYIYREAGLYGMGRKYPLTLDGNFIGELAVQTYIVMTVNPGKHRLLTSDRNVSVVDINMEAGKIYYVWLEPGEVNLSDDVTLRLVDEKRGQASVRAAKRAVPLAPLR